MFNSVLIRKYKEAGLLGQSKMFVELLRAIEIAAANDVRVLLEGQSGTGKELVARAIHRFSERGERPFVAIDSGAIPEALMESELFGHVKGAFTGAASNRKGLFEAANGGTLFLDEITNLSPKIQAKLLRVLQEEVIRPVGSNETRKIDIRIIAASSQPLRKCVDENLFREDLFFRLYVFPIHVPSLHVRQEDIPLITSFYLEKFSVQQDKKIAFMHEDIVNFLKKRKWPGNIRELENFVERLVALAKPGMKIINHDVLPQDFLKEFKRSQHQLSDMHFRKSLEEKLQDTEKQLIREALQATDWNKSQAARLLKIPPPTLRYKIKKYGI